MLGRDDRLCLLVLLRGQYDAPMPLGQHKILV